MLLNLMYEGRSGNAFSGVPYAKFASCVQTDLVQAADGLISAEMGSGPSNLTAVGAPLEAGFVWPQNDLRITVDPVPGAAAVDRAAISRIATEDFLSPAQWPLADRILQWQAHHSIRYGAWLGLRMRQGRVRRKLYLDIPPEAPWQSWDSLSISPPSLIAARGIRPTMLGLDGDRGGMEIYYRCFGLYPSELDSLLEATGWVGRSGEIVRMIEMLRQRTLRHELPSADMGFSLALGADGHALAFTWYSTSRALLGPPSRAREAVLRVGHAAGWSLEGYRSLTEGAITPHHGLIGMTIPCDGPMQLTATVAVDSRQECRYG